MERLDWTCLDSPLYTQNWDVVLAADVVWLTELIPPLVRTFSRVVKAGTVMYLCHQSRSRRADDLLWTLLGESGFVWSLVPREALNPDFDKPACTLYLVTIK